MLVLGMASNSSALAGGDPTSFSISGVPRAHENEYFEVYYLQSSSTPIKVKSTTKLIPKRSALAVRSSSSEKVVVVEYRPVDMATSFMPMVREMKLKMDIAWDKSAMVELSREINTTTWPESVYLARINSVVYWQYMEWVDAYVTHHPVFIPQSICMASDNSNCPYLTQNWDTFIADSFMQLSQYAVSVTPLVPLTRTEWVVHAVSDPQELLYADGMDRYYSLLSNCLRDDPGSDFMTAFGQCLAGGSSVVSSIRELPSVDLTGATAPLLPPVTVFLHYSEHVYIKMTASVAVSPNPTHPESFAPPSAMTAYQLDIPLPPPHSKQFEKQATSDYVIMAGIVVVMAVGLAVGLWKIGFMERVCGGCCPSLCCCFHCCRVGKSSVTRIIGGGSWRNIAQQDDYSDTDDEDDGRAEMAGLSDEMDRASHGFHNQKILRSVSPNQAMSIGSDNDRRNRVNSLSNGSSSGGGKSKSHVLHEAIIKAAAGITGRDSKEMKYAQLRIDDEDDII